MMVVFVSIIYLNISLFISDSLYTVLYYMQTAITANILVILGSSMLPEITTKVFKRHLPYKDVARLFAATVLCY